MYDLHGIRDTYVPLKIFIPSRCDKFMNFMFAVYNDWRKQFSKCYFFTNFEYFNSLENSRTFF